VTFSIAPVSAIADVLAMRGRTGWLTPPLVPVVGAAAPVRGRARTISIEVGTSGPGLGAIYEVLSGDLHDTFLVVAGVTSLEGAMWGEILSLAARDSGAVGVAVDGAIRDRPEIEAMAFPTYGRDQRVVGPYGSAHIVAVDQPVEIAGVTIHPGDSVVADNTGLVRLDAIDADAVLTDAARYAAGEAAVVAALQEGQPLTSAYRYKKEAVEAISRTN